MRLRWVSLIGGLMTISAYGAKRTHASKDNASTSAIGYIELPIRAIGDYPSLKKRLDPGEAPVRLDHNEQAYLIDISIGNHDQTVSLIFDTGSSITWVNPDCSNLGTSKDVCYANSRYNPFNSTTALIGNQTFNITYGAGGALGSYFSDDIRVGNAIARSQKFGVAASSYGCEVGLFGAGFAQPDEPPTILDTLVAQGQISSPAFSVDLRSKGQNGSIILGGIDTKKYKTLQKSSFSSNQALLTSLSLTLHNNNNNNTIKTHPFPPSLWRQNRTDGLPVSFDTGQPTNLLPIPLYQALGHLYPGAVFDGLNESYTVPCEAPEGTFDFSFSDDVSIRVPLRDALVKNMYGECTAGMHPKSTPQDGRYVPFILGASFLRGAYVVFDRGGDAIWMGDKADCGSEVVPFEKGRGAIRGGEGCACEAEQKEAGLES